ncbi:hypothetical protein D9M68_917100 [compost metagenome]
MQRLAGDGWAVEDVAARFLEEADIEQGRIGDAAGKGDHGGLADELEQLADFRGLHGFAAAGQAKFRLTHFVSPSINTRDTNTVALLCQ